MNFCEFLKIFFKIHNDFSSQKFTKVHHWNHPRSPRTSSHLANISSRRTSSRLANISSWRTIVHSIQNTLFSELQFAIGEPRSQRTLVRGGWDFIPRTNFLANCSPVRGGVRANSGELERTPPNSGERSAYSGERSAEFGGV